MPKSLFTIVLLVSILASFMPGVQIAATFDQERLRVLDRKGSSILVRGNAPLNHQGDFDPDMVLRHVQERFQEADAYNQLIVISLLSSGQSDERHILQKQLTYFEPQIHPDVEKVNDIKGQTERHALYHRPITGNWFSPLPSRNLNYLNQLIWKWLRPDDGAWDLAEELHDMLNQSNNAIVYIHCMRGIDRTGLVAGSYLARWKKKEVNIEEILRLNHDIAKRELNWPARNALRWSLWKAQGVKE